MAIDDITLNTTSICDLSLSHLGMKGLTTSLSADVAANNPSAIAINKHWGPARNDVFSEFKWPFANVIQPMQMQVDVSEDDYPEWESFFVYTLNAATIWNIFDESTVEEKEDNLFEVVYNIGLAVRVLCCNLSTLNNAYCEYTHNVIDTTLWSPKFVMAFSYRLAAAICVALTGDAEKALKLMTIYNAYIHEAKRIASSEKKKKPGQTNSIVNSRG